MLVLSHALEASRHELAAIPTPIAIPEHGERPLRLRHQALAIGQDSGLQVLPLGAGRQDAGADQERRWLLGGADGTRQA